MSEDKKIIKTMKRVYPQIYSYILPEFEENNGYQKIGYTERKDVGVRIKEQVETAGKKLKYEKLWSASAIFEPPENGKFFKDKEFHRFLVKNSVENNKELGTEWFYFNGTPEKSKELFRKYQKKDFNFSPNDVEPYKLREEQEAAVRKTLAYARENQTTDFEDQNEKAEFLWNAKPRFGKTLTTYDFAKRFGAKKVLIVTNRPSIANSWFDDYEKFAKDHFKFISTTGALKNRPVFSREEFNQIPDLDKKQITFLSLQDLKQAKIFGGKHNKLEYVADLNWDLLVIDEAHEGADTDKTFNAFDKIKRRFTLHLSGTPFKALAKGKFSEEQIYNWSYLDEQLEKKAELDSGDESGAHVDMPDLRLFTYKMSDLITNKVNEGVEIGDELVDVSFDLNDLFETKNGKFVREDAIRKFLDNLTINEKYPFSTPELRDELKHTFWLIGNRVESAKAMEKLLKSHPVFENYKVILAAGDGRSIKDDNNFEEEADDFKGNEEAFDKVRKAIKENDKTITLSVGKLTTGVTIPEWNAVLMLSGIKTPAVYMQAAFRAQNPYKFYKDGQLHKKKSAYVFDFAPTRVLEMYDDFANSLLSEVVVGKASKSVREQNVAELLNFFPVISEDREGKMIELDAAQVLTFPKSIMAQEVVKKGFITNLLFKNISNVFSLPKEAIEIINNLSEEKNKRTVQASSDISDKNPHENKEIVINEAKEAIFGAKIYKTDIDALINEAIIEKKPEEITKKVEEEILEPIYVKFKEHYELSEKEVNSKKKVINEKVKCIVEDFNNLDEGEKDKDELSKDLMNVIEKEMPEKLVVQKEEEQIEAEVKTEEDKVRARLRSFSRTIPSFIMASKNPENLTIGNLTDDISEEDFKELTSITKEQFAKLRDGFEYVENDQVKKFDGLFDKFIFNASIEEFEEKRKQLSSYFDETQKEDIFDYIPAQKTNQIFTPKKVVKMQLDLLEKENPEIFSNPNTTFADLYMKSGIYITETVKRLYKGLESQIPDENQRLKHILENQVYGFAPTKIIYDIATNFIFGEFDESISRADFKYLDTAELFKNGGDVNMKFDVVIGNPPYQEETGAGSDRPIYNYFMENAYKLSNKVCLITPARFLFNAGGTSKKWNKKMLSDAHLKVLYYQQDSSRVFANTDIKGGVAITLRDATKEFGSIDTFTHFSELNSILRKVRNSKSLKANMGDILYKFNDINIENKLGYKKLEANIFTKLPDLFTKSDGEGLRVFGLENSKRVYKSPIREFVLDNGNLYKFKVLIPKANGSGAIGEVLSTPLIGKPLVGYTRTFIGFGDFDNRNEAENLLKYIKTKFLRTMLGTLKITQNNETKDVWKNVPLQDFTEKSDIDWNKSMAEIDKQLYKKYNLENDEIKFIEEKIKEMK